MGTYYVAVNDVTKEYIDPWEVHEQVIKWNCWQPSCGVGRLVAFVACAKPVAQHEWIVPPIYGNWRWQGDFDDSYYEIKDTYKNITLESIRRYNRAHPNDQLEYHPDED